VGLQRVGGDHRAGKVQAGQQRLEAGNLARGAVDLALGEDGAGGVVHRGEQVALPAVCCAAGAAQGLAVDRDRPSPLVGLVAVCKPRADRGGQRLRVHAGKGPADRGLGGDPHTQWPVRGSRRAPSAARMGWGASAAHSAIAAIDRAPAKTAAAASTRMAASGCRRPARVLGSVTVAR
jgi:hypothetical protein